MNSFRRSFIVFSAFAASYFGEIAINIACGPEPDPYDYYVSFFHNNTPGEAYIPFSFTGLRFLYDETEPQSESLINSKEWAQYLGKMVDATDVTAIMYRTDAATDTVIANYLTDNTVVLPDSLSSNTYLRALAAHRDARNYYHFAKETEPYAVVTYHNYWDPNPRDTMDNSVMRSLGDRAVALAAASRRDRFLALRYAYQAARMYHYAGAYQLCVDVYDQYIADARVNSAAKGWALSLKAGAVRRLGDPATAAYLFSQVFTDRPERRVQAYKNFHYIDVTFDEVLAQAKTNEERAAIQAIQAFNNADFDVQALESVYQLSPKSPLVGVLLTREINKLETLLSKASPYYNGWSWSWYSDPDSIIERAHQHAIWVIDFANRIASEKKYEEPALGTVAASYVHWLLDDPDKADSLLATEDANRLSQQLADQYRIVELLIQVRGIEGSQELDEQAMLPALQWLEQKRQHELDEAKRQHGESYEWFAGSNLRFNRTAANLYQSVLAPYFMQEGDTAMAALMMWKADFPQSTADNSAEGLYAGMSWPTQAFWQQQLQPAALEQLAEWGRGGLDRPWAALVEGLLGTLNSDDYWELLGTAYLRMHDYQAALKAFSHLSPDFRQEPLVNWYSEEEEELWPDPFVIEINDYPKRFGQTGLSKVDFAEAMVNLQQRIVEDPDHAAEYYFQLANGVYQTGAFGNSWSMISYSWTSSDNYVKRDYYYSGDYHEARQAAEWYAKARELSDDREFRAKCTFMLAKCEQKLYQFASISDYYQQVGYNWSRDQPDPFWVFSQRNRYFGELRDGYLDTEFVRRAVAECTYLADFVALDNL